MPSTSNPPINTDDPNNPNPNPQPQPVPAAATQPQDEDEDEVVQYRKRHGLIE